MQWDNPKLNWKPEFTFYATDYNRIKNNTLVLYELASRWLGKFDILDMGEDKTYGDHFYADEINTILDNIETINQRTFKVDNGQKLKYSPNGRTMTYIELNKIERMIVNLWDRIRDELVKVELISVKVLIDKPETFTHAMITCVDETDSSKTKSIKVTKGEEIYFSIIGGHKFHVEYSDVEGFIKPFATSSQTAVANSMIEIEANYTYDISAFRATINVTCPNGVVLSCTNGSTTYTQANVNGQHSFMVYKSGTWTITIRKGQLATSTSVYVATSGQTIKVEMAFPKIYGISRRDDSTSSTWSRIDNAVGKTAIASTGYSSGRSDFNNYYPWSEMKRQIFAGGDVMVKIPEFWYKRYVQNDIEYIQIADKPVDGFQKHPGSGCFVGAYKTSPNFTSVANAYQVTSSDTTWRGTARNNAKAKGEGWGIIDIAAISAIQMLYLVEFADNDSQQTIGYGMAYGGDTKQTGTCDNVPGLTGTPSGSSYQTDVVYRGIEGLWGNYTEWVDGLNLYGQDYYISTNWSDYEDNTAVGYVKLSYRRPRISGCITRMGVDPAYPWAILPVEVNNSDSQATNYSHGFYYNDECVTQDGAYWTVSLRGGRTYPNVNKQGLFYFDFSCDTSTPKYGAACRLMYKG